MEDPQRRASQFQRRVHSGYARNFEPLQNSTDCQEIIGSKPPFVYSKNRRLLETAIQPPHGNICKESYHPSHLLHKSSSLGEPVTANLCFDTESSQHTVCRPSRKTDLDWRKKANSVSANDHEAVYQPLTSLATFYKTQKLNFQAFLLYSVRIAASLPSYECMSAMRSNPSSWSLLYEDEAWLLPNSDLLDLKFHWWRRIDSFWKDLSSHFSSNDQLTSDDVKTFVDDDYSLGRLDIDHPSFQRYHDLTVLSVPPLDSTKEESELGIRRKAVNNWVEEVATKFDFHAGTFSLSIQLLDLYIDAKASSGSLGSESFESNVSMRPKEHVLIGSKNSTSRSIQASRSVAHSGDISPDNAGVSRRNYTSIVSQGMLDLNNPSELMIICVSSLLLAAAVREHFYQRNNFFYLQMILESSNLIFSYEDVLAAQVDILTQIPSKAFSSYLMFDYGLFFLAEIRDLSNRQRESKSMDADENISLSNVFEFLQRSGMLFWIFKVLQSVCKLCILECLNLRVPGSRLAACLFLIIFCDLYGKDLKKDWKWCRMFCHNALHMHFDGDVAFWMFLLNEKLKIMMAKINEKDEIMMKLWNIWKNSKTSWRQFKFLEKTSNRLSQVKVNVEKSKDGLEEAVGRRKRKRELVPDIKKFAKLRIDYPVTTRDS